MKVKNYFGIGVIWVFFFITAFSYATEKNSTYDCRFYNAYITGEMAEWPNWMNELKNQYESSNNPQILYEMVLAYYGYVAYLIGAEREDEAEQYIDEVEEYLPHLKNNDNFKARAEALHGAFIAYKIGINKARAVYLGPRSIRHINNSLKLDQDNPYGWMEKGNAEFHMPRYLGGSYEQAAHYFEKAIKYFEDNPEDLKCNWVYLNALAWLAQSYDKSDHDGQANHIYKKILRIEPNFKWVKEELFPEFKKKE